MDIAAIMSLLLIASLIWQTLQQPSVEKDISHIERAHEAVDRAVLDGDLARYKRKVRHLKSLWQNSFDHWRHDEARLHLFQVEVGAIKFAFEHECYRQDQLDQMRDAILANSEERRLKRQSA